MLLGAVEGLGLALRVCWRAVYIQSAVVVSLSLPPPPASTPSLRRASPPRKRPRRSACGRRGIAQPAWLTCNTIESPFRLRPGCLGIKAKQLTRGCGRRIWVGAAQFHAEVARRWRCPLCARTNSHPLLLSHSLSEACPSPHQKAVYSCNAALTAQLASRCECSFSEDHGPMEKGAGKSKQRAAH